MTTVSLKRVLTAGYKNKTKQKNALKEDGFEYDGQLSNDNEQVWYRPRDHQLIFNVSGTHNLKDWGTDLWLAFGDLKGTDRYKEADDILKKAKSKYGVVSADLTGHSLGGGIVSLLGSKNDNVKTLDKATTLFQPTRSNEQSYRTSGDIVSIANANSTRTKTLSNPNQGSHTGVFPLDFVRDTYNAHDIKNIGNNIKLN
jgi:hypothetical protein